jgi:hypothetical protein
LYNTLTLPPLLYDSENWTIKTTCNKNNSSRDEVNENSRINLDRSQKYKHCKGIKYNPSFGQNTGLQEKMDTTCKLNAM